MLYILHATTAGEADSASSPAAQSRLIESLLRGFAVPHRIETQREDRKLLDYQGRRRTMGLPRVYLDRQDGSDPEHIGVLSSLIEHLNREFPTLPPLDNPLETTTAYSSLAPRAVKKPDLARAWLQSPARKMPLYLSERDYHVVGLDDWGTIVQEIQAAHGDVGAQVFAALVSLHYQVSSCAVIIDYGENRSYNGLFVDAPGGIQFLCCDPARTVADRIHALPQEIANGAALIG